MQRIILTGYYGWGNLGDDVLMISSYQIVGEMFPQAEIIVCTESSMDSNSYIKSMLGNVNIINRSTHMVADWIVHGGGGVYFDFSEGGIKDLVTNSIIKILGYRFYRKLYGAYKSIFSRGTVSRYRAGIGIGIGRFTSSSPKFAYSIYTLMDFSILFVRDQESINLLRKYKFKQPAYVSADIAFNTYAWLNKSLLSNRSVSGGVAFILRDWHYDNHLHHEIALEAAQRLQEEGVRVRFYSFDRLADSQYIHRASSAFPMRVYNAEQGIDDFLADLKDNTCIVTSRAHGAILSACMGITGICIVIEPKLKSVTQMLNRSYASVELTEGAGRIIEEANLRLGNSRKYADMVREDVQENTGRLFESMKTFKSFVEELQLK